MLNEGIAASIWATLGTYRAQWRAGCRPWHVWRPSGEFLTARGELLHDQKLLGTIQQCRRCGAIRGA